MTRVGNQRGNSATRAALPARCIRLGLLAQDQGEIDEARRLDKKSLDNHKGTRRSIRHCHYAELVGNTRRERRQQAEARDYSRELRAFSKNSNRPKLKLCGGASRQ